MTQFHAHHSGPEFSPHPDALRQRPGPATWADVIEPMRAALPESMSMLQEVHRMLQMPRFNFSRIRQADRYVRQLAMKEGIPMAELNRLAPRNPRELAQFVQQAMAQLSMPGRETVVDPLAVQVINPVTGDAERLMYDAARHVYVPVPVAPAAVPVSAPAPIPAPIVDAPPPLPHTVLQSSDVPSVSPKLTTHPQFFEGLSKEDIATRSEHFRKLEAWKFRLETIMESFSSDTDAHEWSQRLVQLYADFPIVKDMQNLADTPAHRESGAFAMESLVLWAVTDMAKLQGADLEKAIEFASEVRLLVKNMENEAEIMGEVETLLKKYKGTEVGTYFEDLAQQVSAKLLQSRSTTTHAAPSASPAIPSDATVPAVSAAPTPAPIPAPVEKPDPAVRASETRKAPTLMTPREQEKIALAMRQVGKQAYAEDVAWYIGKKLKTRKTAAEILEYLKETEKPNPTTDTFHNQFCSPFTITDQQMNQAMLPDLNHIEIAGMRTLFEQNPEQFPKNEVFIASNTRRNPNEDRRMPFGNQVDVVRMVARQNGIENIEPKDVLYYSVFTDADMNHRLGFAIVHNGAPKFLFQLVHNGDVPPLATSRVQPAASTETIAAPAPTVSAAPASGPDLGLEVQQAFSRTRTILDEIGRVLQGNETVGIIPADPNTPIGRALQELTEVQNSLNRHSTTGIVVAQLRILVDSRIYHSLDGTRTFEVKLNHNIGQYELHVKEIASSPATSTSPTLPDDPAKAVANPSPSEKEAKEDNPVQNARAILARIRTSLSGREAGGVIRAGGGTKIELALQELNSWREEHTRDSTMSTTMKWSLLNQLIAREGSFTSKDGAREYSLRFNKDLNTYELVISEQNSSPPPSDTLSATPDPTPKMSNDNPEAQVVRPAEVGTTPDAQRAWNTVQELYKTAEGVKNPATVAKEFLKWSADEQKSYIADAKGTYDFFLQALEDFYQRNDFQKKETIPKGLVRYFKIGDVEINAVEFGSMELLRNDIAARKEKAEALEPWVPMKALFDKYTPEKPYSKDGQTVSFEKMPIGSNGWFIHRNGVQTARASLILIQDMPIWVETLGAQGKSFYYPNVDTLLEALVAPAPASEQEVARERQEDQSEEKKMEQFKAIAKDMRETLSKGKPEEYAKLLAWYLNNTQNADIDVNVLQKSLRYTENPKYITDVHKFHDLFASPYDVSDANIFDVQKRSGYDLDFLALRQIFADVQDGLYEGKTLRPSGMRVPLPLNTPNTRRMLKNIAEEYKLDIKQENVIYVQRLIDHTGRAYVGIAVRIQDAYKFIITEPR